jgi:hypothetical protein
MEIHAALFSECDRNKTGTDEKGERKLSFLSLNESL